MASRSLILRSEKGSKLTIEEMDSNLTYLQNRISYEIINDVPTGTTTHQIEIDNEINDIIILAMNPVPTNPHNARSRCYIIDYSVMSLYGQKYLEIEISNVGDTMDLIFTLMNSFSV